MDGITMFNDSSLSFVVMLPLDKESNGEKGVISSSSFAYEVPSDSKDVDGIVGRSYGV